MKSCFFLRICPFLLLSLLAGCGQQSSHGDFTAVDTAAVRPAIHQITREFPVYADFFQITNIGSFQVEISTGPFHVEATGDSSLLAALIYDIDGGCLTLSMPVDENSDINRYDMRSGVTFHVTMPELRILANCSSGNINIPRPLHTSGLHIGAMGSGSIRTDSIYCDHFKFEGSRNTAADIRFVECQESEILSYGAAPVTASVHAARSAVFDVGGKSHADIAVASPFVDINSTGSGNSLFNIQADRLAVSHQGSGSLTLRGRAAHGNIRHGNHSKLVNELQTD